MYIYLFGSQPDSTTEASRYQKIPTAGTLRELRVEITVAPDNGAGTQSFAFTVRSAAAETALANTSITCTISEAETSCNDLANTASVSAGDRVSISIVPTTTPAITGLIRTTLIFESTLSDESLYTCGDDVTGSQTANRYMDLIGDCFMDANVGDVEFPVAVSGSVKNLYVEIGTEPGAGKSRIYTVQINGADSSPAVTCTISGTANVCSDTSNVETYVQYDDLTLEDTPSGTPALETNVHATVIFAADTSGNFLTGWNDDDAKDGTNTLYTKVNRHDISFTATVTNEQQIGQGSAVVTDMDFEIATAPGAGNSWQITFNVNGTNNTEIQCTISGTGTSCTDTGQVVVADGDNLAFEVDPTGTPTTTAAAWIGGLAWNRITRRVLVE